MGFSTLSKAQPSPSWSRHVTQHVRPAQSSWSRHVTQHDSPAQSRLVTACHATRQPTPVSAGHGMSRNTSTQPSLSWLRHVTQHDSPVSAGHGMSRNTSTQPSLSWSRHVTQHDSPVFPSSCRAVWRLGDAVVTRGKCSMDDVGDWTTLPMPKLLTVAFRREH